MALAAKRAVLALALLVLLLAPAGGAHARAKDPERIPGRYIVVYERSVDNVDAETTRQERAGGFQARYRYRHALRGFAARLSSEQVERLRRDPDVAYVTPDRPVHALAAAPVAAGEPVPPPGIRRIEAATPTTVRQASSASVAIVDTGIDLDHPDLNAVAGTNCITPGSAPEDGNGHGTHVSGTVGARNDGAGVVGVAPGTLLRAVKVLDSSGSGSWASVTCGIDWVAANAKSLNIRVVNMSLGGLGQNDRACGSTNNDALHQAICRATAAGVLNVVAAGNDDWDIGDDPPDVPAAYPEVLTVTAIADTDGLGGGTGPEPDCWPGTDDDGPADFTSYATRPEDTAHMIAAPGVCVRSTWLGGGYDTISGTSMATPHVAGAVALCVGEAGASGPCTNLTPAQIVDHMRSEAAAHSAAVSGYGFPGDPLSPLANGHFLGYLVHVAPVDSTPPDTTIAGGPAGVSESRAYQFSFSATEAGSTFECRLDGAAWAACSSPHAVGGVTDGQHTFEVRARDASGNVDPSPAARSFTVKPTPPRDTIAPDASIAISSRHISSVLTKGLRAKVRCSEACAVGASLSMNGSAARRLGIGAARTTPLGTAAYASSASGRRTVVVKLPKRIRAKLRRARSLKVKLLVTVVDGTGNLRKVSARASLVR